MQRGQIGKAYVLDGTRIERCFSVLGLDPKAEAIPNALLDDLELVVGWLKEDKGLSDADAKARYEQIKATRPDALPSVSDAVNSALAATRPQIEHEVSQIYGQTSQILGDIKGQFIAGVYAIAGQVLLREAQNMRPVTVIDQSSQTALPAMAEEVKENA